MAVKPLKNTVPSFQKARFIGLGGAGCAVAALMANQNSDSLEVLMCDTDHKLLGSLSDKGVSQKLFGPSTLKGLSCGGDATMGRKATRESASLCKELLSGTDLVFLVGGLGGGFATGAMQEFVQIAKEAQVPVICLVIRPFDFESPLRNAAARDAVSDLKKSGVPVFIVSNDVVARHQAEGRGAYEVFECANARLLEIALSLNQILTQQAIQTLDGRKLIETLQYYGVLDDGCMALGDAEGEISAEIALNEVLESSIFINEARHVWEGCIVFTTGGSKLTVADTRSIEARVKKEFAQNIDVLGGATMDPAFEERTRILVLAFPAQPETEATPDASLEADVVTPVETSLLPAMTRVPEPMVQVSHKNERGRKASEQQRTTKVEVRQEALKFESPSSSAGRFEKVEATLYKGENLDQPTWMRKGFDIRQCSV